MSGYHVIQPPPVQQDELVARVRVVSVSRHAYNGDGEQYVGMAGRITGVSGQFVVVQLEYDQIGSQRGEDRPRLFLPTELVTINEEAVCEPSPTWP